MKQFRYRLYRLQQRLAITRREAIAVILLAGLLLVGAVRLYVQHRPPPSPDAQAARAFSAGTATLEAAPGDSAGPQTSALPQAGWRIPLNTATRAQLERLPRIGPVLAARILAYRKANGPFAGVEELADVRGIGSATVERLAPLVYISSSDSSTAL